MKLVEFRYQKATDPIATKRRVIVLSEDSDHVAGLDLDKLEMAEAIELKKAFSDFQDVASKYMGKAFRNFKKTAILD